MAIPNISIVEGEVATVLTELLTRRTPVFVCAGSAVPDGGGDGIDTEFIVGADLEAVAAEAFWGGGVAGGVRWRDKAVGEIASRCEGEKGEVGEEEEDWEGSGHEAQRSGMEA